MSEKKQLTGDPRIDFKWFSRRHQSNEKHSSRQAERDARRDDKSRGIVERAAARAERTPREQIALLDQRPGAAAKERARLSALSGK